MGDQDLNFYILGRRSVFILSTATISIARSQLIAFSGEVVDQDLNFYILGRRSVFILINSNNLDYKISTYSILGRSGGSRSQLLYSREMISIYFDQQQQSHLRSSRGSGFYRSLYIIRTKSLAIPPILIGRKTYRGNPFYLLEIPFTGCWSEDMGPLIDQFDFVLPAKVFVELVRGPCLIFSWISTKKMF